MSAIFVCDKCKRSYQVSKPSKRVFCSCGAVGENPVYKQQDEAYQCIHRGEVLGDLDCGCAGKPKVYACDIHGKCAIRKMKPGDFGVIYCNGCDDISLYRQGRVGLALSVFNKIGGVETWANAIAGHVASITGIATSGAPHGKPAVPIHQGSEALDDLCKTSKNIFAWGCTDDLAESYKLYPSANLVAVHHGSLASSWGNDVFKRQLEFCRSGVAVNRDVANRFGVRFIRNPVDPTRSDPQGDMPEQLRLLSDYKIVLWNHRPSAEKRPSLAQEIAELLPNGWKMLFTGDNRIISTPKLINIGQIGHPGHYLSRCSVFLSTADQEAFGYSLAEAILANRPTVAAPAGLALDGWTSEVVESDHPSVWVDAILRADREMPADLALRREMLEKEYLPAVVMPQWESLLV